MHGDFHTKVGHKHGLTLRPRLTPGSKRAQAEAVLNHIKQHEPSILASPAWQAYRAVIVNSPTDFVLQYGLTVVAPAKKLRSSTAIFTSPCKATPKKHHEGRSLIAERTPAHPSDAHNPYDSVEVSSPANSRQRHQAAKRALEGAQAQSTSRETNEDDCTQASLFVREHFDDGWR
ncbi:hypothetical protein [Aquabacterium sp.]|uniref:hypothetical protein n=1 Tax=Aquabacterium sp. TaxID=1872578 RepID=UPI0025C53925|nr:hypothetical protein [Aquabacterium sp.]